MKSTVLFLGGNGHCAARLGDARTALARLGAPFDLVEPALPGFEGRPRAATLDAFLDAVAAAVGRPSRPLLYATGIGGLLALCLRARGELLAVPLLLQAPVLWGLERRWMPRLMRLRPARRLLGQLFAWGWFQRRFVGRYFEKRPAAEVCAAFFRGYAECAAAADFFAWLTPALLRRLEADFARRPEALADVRVWWGGRDRVVTLQELDWTRMALKVDWPVRTFPTWGHYPMIDQPDEWTHAVQAELAAVGLVP